MPVWDTPKRVIVKWGLHGLVLVLASAASGQSVGSGTAVAIYRSPDIILAAVDSKEVYTEYRDGVPSVIDKVSCKLTRVGPWYVVVSGVVSGTNGFDVLREAERAYAAGLDFRQTTEYVREKVSKGLGGLLGTLADLHLTDFASAYLNHVILQVAVFGSDSGVPRVRLLEYQAGYGQPGVLTVSSTAQECPGDCGGDRFVYLLGAHEVMENFLRSNPALVGKLDPKRIEDLVRMEYQARPDIVGGPISLIEIDKTGRTSFRGGACMQDGQVPSSKALPESSPGRLSVRGATIPIAEVPAANHLSLTGTARVLELIRSDIERKLSNVAHAWCHETIYRYSQMGTTVKPSEKIEADVELDGGAERYTSVRSGAKNYDGIRQTGGAWSSGEVATILRTSGELLREEPGSVTGVVTKDDGETSILSFRHTSPLAAWIIEIGSRSWPISFEGKIWISNTTGEIKRVEWRGIRLPREMALSGVEWSVGFGPVMAAGRPSTGPIKSTYVVAYKGSMPHIDRNETFFSDIGGYGSDSVIHFDAEESGVRGDRDKSGMRNH